jgi:cobaltochelatase CobT
MMTNIPLEDALTTTTRALAKAPKLRLAFGANASRAQEVALPPLDAENMPTIRGYADRAAITLKLHNPSAHRTLAPADAGAAKAFHALEQARIDVLGAMDMRGVQENIGGLIAKEKWQEEADIFAASLGAMVRKHLAYMPVPEALQNKTAMLELLIGSKAPRALEALQASLNDQPTFGKHALQLLERLSLAAEAEERTPLEPETEAGETVEDQKTTSGEAEPDFSSDAGGTASGEEAAEQETGETLEQALNPDAPPSQSELPNWPSNTASALPLEYKAFTREFDQIIPAEELAKPEELHALSEQLRLKMAPYASTIAKLSAKLQRLLLAKRAHTWLDLQEEGVLDNRRLTRIITAPMDGQFYKKERVSEFRDTIVTLLIDNSGSMRGRPITIAAMSAMLLGQTLERCGVKVEILGFTTRDWKGGQSAKAWMNAGKPAHAGRLNDLRHIIYKSANAPFQRASRNLGLMMKEGILKENIDGEAILWAASRLMKRPEERRILMVISDGAPVDDQTLSINGSNYLDAHLREVIATVENGSPIELLAIGIGHDVTRYYKHAVRISEAEKLPEVMTQELTELFG